MPDLKIDTPTDSRSFSERTHEVIVGPCRLVVLPVAVEGVVSFAGAIRTAPDLLRGDGLIQELVTLLLDKGTRSRDRFAIADLIDNRGAQINFRSSPLRITFSGRSLVEDLPEVLSLLAEQLREPLFDSEEFAKARTRLTANLRRSNENTGARATGLLSRLIYPPGHPNYINDPDEELGRLATVGVERVHEFYESHVGANELTLVVTGDVDVAQVETVVSGVFSGWPSSQLSPVAVETLSRVAPGVIQDVLPEKKNVDVRMGHRLPIRRDQPDYVPLFVGIFALGGNFSARLMNIVRDKLGLTYGINAGVTGTSVEYAGHFRVAVTLSPEHLRRGMEATQDVIRQFVAEGVSRDEVEAVKETIGGSFVVDLATTGGLAYSLLINHLRGFGTEYLDRFPSEIAGTTPERVNEAIRGYLSPDDTSVALSGAIEVDH